MTNNSTIIIRGGTIILVGNGDGGNANEKADSLDIINILPGTKIDDKVYDGTNNDQKMSYVREGKVVICTDANRGDTVRHSCQFVFIPTGGGAPIIGTINSTISGFMDAVMFLELEIPTPDCILNALPNELLVHGISIQKKRNEIVPALKYLSMQVKVT